MTEEAIKKLAKDCWNRNDAKDRSKDIILIFAEHTLKHLGLAETDHVKAMEELQQIRHGGRNGTEERIIG